MTEEHITPALEVASDALIEHMVQRFLMWRLPANFNPDAGIKFEPEFNTEYNIKHRLPPQRHEPRGTNLFDYRQAEEMVRHMVNGAPRLSFYRASPAPEPVAAMEPVAWRPIETAPKDGTWILIRGRNAANYPMIPVVCRWAVSANGGGSAAWRDSGSDRDMSQLIYDVPLGSSADWLPLYAHPPADPLMDEVREALELFARLEIPKRPDGNAGLYSIPFKRIERARATLAKLEALR